MPDVAQLIGEAAWRYGVNPALAIEVGMTESGLDPNVSDSSAGAIGVMQLMPGTAAQLGVNPRILEENIDGGVRYLGMQLAQFGSPDLALAAYNWGPGNVSAAVAQWGDTWLDHAPGETRGYVSRILGNLGIEYQTRLSLPFGSGAFRNALLLAGIGLFFWWALHSAQEASS